MKRRKYHKDERSSLSIIKETEEEEDPLYLIFKESKKQKERNQLSKEEV